jgi:hypothetical protein
VPIKARRTFKLRHYRALPTIMPRDAIFLSDVRGPVLTVIREACGRRERHDVESLKRQHGGA